jgi:transcriptional regulator GlxA family with amidase domain
MTTTRPIVVALLATPEVTAATLYGFHDLLAGAGRDWNLLHGRPVAPTPIFDPVIASRDGRPVTGANGVTIVPRASFDTCPPPAVVCITDLMVAPGEPLGERFDPEVEWIRACHTRGATITSACSGAVLLARTGLLDGLEATSHWAYCESLAHDYPRTRWSPERGLVAAGEGERLLMSGSGAAWHLLVLALISRFAGAEEAMRVARINLLDGHLASPIAYASLVQRGRTDDPVIGHCQQWVAMNYATEAPVMRMIALSGLAERTFKRRFSLATGMSPLEYVHKLRLEEAKQMLEAGDQSVDDVAAEVGYRDSSFFGRLFRRQVAMTPAQYRRRFGGLKRRLESARPPTSASSPGSSPSIRIREAADLSRRSADRPAS